MHDLPAALSDSIALASGITFFAKIYIQGTVGPWHIRLENMRKKKKKLAKRSQAGNR